MEFLKNWLANAEENKCCRHLTPVHREVGKALEPVGESGRHAGVLDFSSNDYLGLSQHPALIEAASSALKKFGTGAGSARLMSGDLEIFHQLEEETARLKGHESALLFGSGYLANIGVIPALVGRGDVIFSDRLNHASIYDGCRLSGARLVRFRHNDLGHLSDLLTKHTGNGKRLIVVESVYSMDGDICPLSEIISLKNRFSAMLMVDEAHATGIFGDNGGGIITRDGVADDVEVAMGTYGKALGTYGAYISGSSLLKQYLINRARSFVFTTALPPAAAAASLEAVTLVKGGSSLRRKLFDNVSCFKETLQQGGIPGRPGPSQIVPLHVGHNDKALEMAGECRRKGMFATAVRPPTVPQGEARLRFSVTLHHSRKELVESAEKIIEISNRLSIPVSF